MNWISFRSAAVVATAALSSLLVACGEVDYVHQCETSAGYGVRDPQRYPPVAFDKIEAEAAMDSCKKAVEKAPGDGWAWFNLGRAYVKNGNAADAEGAFKRAYEFGNIYALINLGRMYGGGVVIEKDIDKAAGYFKKFLEEGGKGENAAFALSFLVSNLPDNIAPVSGGERQDCPLNKELAALATKIDLGATSDLEFALNGADNYAYAKIQSDGDTHVCIAYLADPELNAQIKCRDQAQEKIREILAIYPELEEFGYVREYKRDFEEFSASFSVGSPLPVIHPVIRFNKKSGDLTVLEYRTLFKSYDKEDMALRYSKVSNYIKAKPLCALLDMTSDELKDELKKVRP